MQRLRAISCVLVFSVAALVGPRVQANPGGDEKHSLTVSAEPSSSLFTIKVNAEKKLGEIRIQVRNNQGDVVYSEAGKAKTDELVRYLDKNIFRKGTYQIEIFTKDFSITQYYKVE